MPDAAPRKSTIDRSFRRAGTGLVRAAFRTLDPVAPGLAARWAVRIWCTPPGGGHHRTEAAAGRHRTAAPGTRFTVSRNGTAIAAEAWGDRGPITYLLHGWGGWRGHLASLIRPLVAAGHRVVALDGIGHGESGSGRLGGRRTHLGELAESLAAVVAVAGPAHAVVAHSGGASAAALAVHDGLAADRLVFINPMADPRPYVDPFADLLGVGPRARPRLAPRIEELVGRALAEFDVPGRAAAAGTGGTAAAGTGGAAAGTGAAAALPRLLVIHDRNDRQVRYADGRAIASAWPGAILHATQGLGHRRILDAPAVVEAAVSFVTDGVPARLTAATAAGSTRSS